MAFKRTKWVAGLFGLLICSGSALALDVPGKSCRMERPPRFDDFKVAVEKISRRPALKFNNDFSRRYRTLLREGLSGEPVDFAGHYVMVTFGCGTTCLYGGMVDAKSGQATGLPFMLDSFGPFDIDTPLIYRADSRLIIMLGMVRKETEPPAKFYYEWTGRRLKPLCYFPVTSGAWNEE